MRLKYPLLLASASPRRQQLLARLGLPFTVQSADIPEQRHPYEPPHEYVQRLAAEKASTVLSRLPDKKLVLGADTIVVFGDLVMEKPRDQRHAAEMLRQLSGQTHQVMTAIALTDGLNMVQSLVISDVTFRMIDEQEIADYWCSGEPVDKAGGYAIQGLGGRFVTRLIGSYFAVVGLPLYETEMQLRRFVEDSEC